MPIRAYPNSRRDLYLVRRAKWRAEKEAIEARIRADMEQVARLGRKIAAAEVITADSMPVIQAPPISKFRRSTTPIAIQLPMP